MDVKYDKNVEEQRMFVEVQVKRPRKGSAADIVAGISQIDGVKRVRVD